MNYNGDEYKNAPISPIGGIMIIGNTDMINWTERGMILLFILRKYANTEDHNHHSWKMFNLRDLFMDIRKLNYPTSRIRSSYLMN